jgi:hypothetical protein
MALQNAQQREANAIRIGHRHLQSTHLPAA